MEKNRLMAKILDGKILAQKIKNELKIESAELLKKNILPKLAVIMAGENKASEIYVKNKIKACNEVGIKAEIYNFSSDSCEDELISLIRSLNNDKYTDGVLVQLPLPSNLDENKILSAISPDKDVDGFCDINQGKLIKNKPNFVPCTAAGILEIFKHYNIDVSSKTCTIIGRSNIVGKPLAMLMLNLDSTVTICHSKTIDLKSMTQNADIVISAVGKAKFVTEDMVKKGAIVIDVGINRDENNKISGDVDFDSVKAKASYITTVPGGVGPLTVAMLIKNTIKSAKERLNKDVDKFE